MIFVFSPTGACLEKNLNSPSPSEAVFKAKFGDDVLIARYDQDPLPGVLESEIVATIEDGQVVEVAIDPDYTPPAPAPDPVQALREDVAHLQQVVATTIPSSPHDRRYLTDKEIGKMLIPWLKANPSATVQQATDYVVPLILAELPGQPVIPPLYWEWTDPATQEVRAFGLGMSYLYEARVRGYCPPETPLTWEALVSLVVATPEEQIAAWLRSL
jgi:hypothetical protein